MFCRTWDHLYQQYESASLKRLQKSKALATAKEHPEYEKLNTSVADALRKLREHELQHGCR